MIAEVVADHAVTDLVLQTGPIGTLVVVLGGLVRGWITGLKSDIADLKTQVGAQAKRDDELVLEVRDLGRRVSAIEAAKKAGPP